MSVNLSLLGGAGWQFFTDNGTPLAGGLLYTYLAGTSTAATTYTTSAGNVPNSNPIVLNSAGRVQTEIWLTQGVSYKFVLKTSAFITIGTYDNIDGAADPAPFYAFEAALAASSGSSLVGFIQSGSGAVATTVQAKLRQIVSVIDFGADPTGVTDSTAAIQAALDSIPNGANSYAPTKLSGGAGRVTIWFPNGQYSVSSTLDCSQRDYCQMIGEGRATINSSSTDYIIDMSSTDHCVMQNLALTSSTARVGIYIDRCTTAPFVQFNTYDNVAINLATNTAANSGIGRIGIWNGRGELNVFTNVEIRADLPMYATNTADANFSPVSGTLQTAYVTSVQNTYVSCEFISHTVNTSCIVLDGCIEHEFRGCYWATANVSSGTSPYAITAYGISSCKFTGTVETLPSFMLVKQAILYFNDINIAVQNNFDGRGAIQLEDSTAIVGFCSGSVTIGSSGSFPAGSSVINCSTASLGNVVRGVTIQTLSSLPGLRYSSSNSTVDGNVIGTEAGYTVDSCTVIASQLTSPLSGIKTAATSGVAYTIASTTQYAAYQVFAFVYNGGSNLVATATFINDGTNLIILNYAPGAFLTLTVSGTNIQATQSSGSSVDIVYKILQIS